MTAGAARAAREPIAPPALRDMRDADAPAVLEIYAQGIATATATFETTPPDWPTWDAAHLATPRLVTDAGATVLGWAALSPVSDRCAYGGVAEVSVYMAEEARGRGIGRQLLQALTQRSEQAGIWTLQAGIIMENTASVAVHRAAGFRVVGRRERIGKLNGTWRDVLLLERRSALAGR